MFFASDNWAGAHPNIAAVLSADAGGLCHRLWRRRARPRVDAALQRDFRARGRGLLRRHRHGRQLAVADRVQQARRHRLLPIAKRMCIEDECGAPEYFSGGCSPSCRSTAIWARSTRHELETGHRPLRARTSSIAASRSAVTITQATEVGTIYPLAEIDEIAAIATNH